MASVYSYHTSKEGERILVCSMTDRHLKNTINVICQEMEKLATVLNGDFQSTVSDPLLQHLVPQADTAYLKHQAKDKFRILEERLSAYVMEASIRNMDVQKYLLLWAGRTERVDAPTIGSTSQDVRLLEGDK